MQRLGARLIVDEMGEDSSGKESLGAGGWRRVRCAGESDIEPPSSLAKVVPLVPEATESPREAKRIVGAVCVESPRQRGTKVVVVALERLEPCSLLGPGELRCSCSASSRKYFVCRCVASSDSFDRSICSAAYSRIVSSIQ